MAMTHRSNFQRWFADAVESNAWSLMLLGSTPPTVCILGVWAALTAYSSSDTDVARDVHDPRFDAFPIADIQQFYITFSTGVFTTLGIVLPLVCFYLVGAQLPDQRLARVVDALIALQAALTLVLIGTLVLSQQSAAQQMERVQARDSSVNAAFNEFYCTARIGSLCSDPAVSVTALRAVFSDGVTRTDASATDSGCRYLFTQLQSSSSESQSARRVAFLHLYASSDAVDAWCGAFVLARAAAGGDVRVGATRASASPDTVYSAIFRDFDVAWTSRLEFDAIMLSIVCALQLLLCVAWTRMLASDKRPILPIDADKKFV